MNIHSIDRQASVFRSELLHAYMRGDLKALHSFSCDEAGIAEAIAYRSDFPHEQRQLLQKAIQEQYQTSEIDLDGSPIEQQIKRLGQSNCFTVTTGQQIHIGLGPLYVLYKIINVIQITRSLNETYEDKHFVPIFWMATEDHDLEEIRDVNFFGRSYRWETEQGGAVGRMQLQGVHEVFEELAASSNLNPQQEAFVSLLKKAYESENLAKATRWLVHQLFGKEGLVVLDGDSYALKSSFTKVFENELKGLNYNSLEQGTRQLIAKGFEKQIHIRPINLFYLTDSDRQRIERQGNDLVAGETVLCPLHELSKWVETHAQSISPNVALRPLYQECVLPNIAYVGGPSEVKYWLQLGALFEQNGMKLPVIIPRTSNIYLPEKQLKQLNINDITQMHKDEKEFLGDHSKEVAEVGKALHAQIDAIQQELKRLAQEFSRHFKGSNIDGKVNKLYPKLTELQTISDKKTHDLAVNDPQFNRIIKFKRSYFSAETPQERKAHIVQYPELIEELLEDKHSHGLGNLLKINHLLSKGI